MNQKEIKEQLVKLIQENPELEIITLVDKDVVVDDTYDQWYGNLNRVKIDYYYNDDGENCLKTEDRDHLIQKFIEEAFEYDMNCTIDRAISWSQYKFEDLDWKKVIVIYIGV